jgi:sodium transport system permease protein
MNNGNPAPGPPPTTPAGHHVSRLARLASKELREILRDRRTLVTLVAMPLLLYPLLGLAFRQFFLSGAASDSRPKFRIAVQAGSDQNAAQIRDYLLDGRAALERFPGWPNPAWAETKLNPVLEFFGAENAETAVREGQVDIGLRLRSQEPVQFRPDRDLAVDCELLYVEDALYGREALRYVESLCAAANARFLEHRLQSLRDRDVRQRGAPVELVRTPLTSTGQKYSLSLAAVVPLILILMTITGAVYPAIDLTAGERERGTLEILIAAPIARLSLLLAKYVAVVAVALLTAVVNLTAMLLTLWLSGLGPILFGQGGVSPLAAVEVLGVLVLFASFFAAVLLVLTSFARSFKEAQAYLIPLMVVSLVPGMIGILPGMELSGPLALVPLLNIVLLTRDLFQGKAGLLPALVVVLATAVYALAAVVVAARVFGAETVLYSEQGGWWRRRAKTEDRGSRIEDRG